MLITVELIEAKELMFLKVTTTKNKWSVTIVFLIMDSNFKILYAMVAMIQ